MGDKQLLRDFVAGECERHTRLIAITMYESVANVRILHSF